jgi:hypothetical protein
MPAERGERFIDALGRLERDGDVETIAALFAHGADVSNPMVEHDGGGMTAFRTYFDPAPLTRRLHAEP